MLSSTRINTDRHFPSPLHLVSIFAGVLVWLLRALICRTQLEAQGRAVLVTGCDTGIGHHILMTVNHDHNIIMFQVMRLPVTWTAWDAWCLLDVRWVTLIMIQIMTMMMSEHGLGGRPEAAGGGQPPPAAGQHGRDPAQPRGDGHQVSIAVLVWMSYLYHNIIMNYNESAISSFILKNIIQQTNWCTLWF